MPKVKRSRKPPPDGWELIEPTLDELDQKMREAETDPHEGKRKVEALWPIFRLHHQKSRYIYDLFYRRKAISRELYEYCLKENIADKNLIAKWKKQGYENLCCLRCIQARDTNFGANCICRVPRSKLESEGCIRERVGKGCGKYFLNVAALKRHKVVHIMEEEMEVEEEDEEDQEPEQEQEQDPADAPV